MRIFSEDMPVETIIQILGWHTGMRKPTGPGQAVLACDELTREKFRNLKSDDLTKIRPDIAVWHGCHWDYKEIWECNVGKISHTRIPDDYCTVMLLRFDRNVLGIKKDIKLSAAEKWAWQQSKENQFYWNEKNWKRDGT
jgi:hypothetical protein